MLIIKKNTKALLKPGGNTFYKHWAILVSISIKNNQQEAVIRLLILYAEALLKDWYTQM